MVWGASIPCDVIRGALTAHVRPENCAWVRDASALLRSGGSRRLSREPRARRADGSRRWFDAVAVDLLDNPGVRDVAVYLHDLTGRRQPSEQLGHRALRNPLTELPNRALSEDAYGRVVTGACGE